MLYGLLAVSAFTFFYRGFLRGLERFNDYYVNYLGTRAWLAGLNPYDPAATSRVRPEDLPQVGIHAGTAYPPAVFPLSTPFALLDVGTSKIVFLIFTSVLYLIVCTLMLKSIRESASRNAGIAFIALCVLAYPAHTALSLGQYSMLSFCFLVLSFVANRRDASRSAGILAAISLAAKPQLGIVSIVYFMTRQQWRPAIVAVSLYAGFTAIALIKTSAASGSLAWILDSQSHIRDIAAQQSQLYCCVNLRMITRLVIEPAVYQLVFDMVVFLCLLGAWFSASRRTDDALLSFSVLSAVFLLPLYHRPYDLVLAIPFLAWFLSNIATIRHPFAVGSLLILFVQPIPTLGLLATLAPHGLPQVPEPLSALYRILVVPHTTWLLLALVCYGIARMVSGQGYPGLCHRSERAGNAP